jgi:uncharacterized protein (DUF2267 family)
MAIDLKGLARSVAERTSLSREESADITWAVLQGLAGQLSQGEARHLAVDLPDPLAELLQAPRRRKQGAHPVAVRDFIRQVSQRTGLTEHDARAGTAAVLAALRQTLGQEDYGHLVGQLPAAYSGLVEVAG